MMQPEVMLGTLRQLVEPVAAKQAKRQPLATSACLVGLQLEHALQQRFLPKRTVLHRNNESASSATILHLFVAVFTD